MNLGYVPPWGSIMKEDVPGEEGYLEVVNFNGVISSQNTRYGDKEYFCPGLMKPPVLHFLWKRTVGM